MYIGKIFDQLAMVHKPENLCYLLSVDLTVPSTFAHSQKQLGFA